MFDIIGSHTFCKTGSCKLGPLSDTNIFGSSYLANRVRSASSVFSVVVYVSSPMARWAMVMNAVRLVGSILAGYTCLSNFLNVSITPHAPGHHTYLPSGSFSNHASPTTLYCSSTLLSSGSRRVSSLSCLAVTGSAAIWSTLKMAAPVANSSFSALVSSIGRRETHQHCDVDLWSEIPGHIDTPTIT